MRLLLSGATAPANTESGNNDAHVAEETKKGALAWRDEATLPFLKINSEILLSPGGNY